jgi:hypothetical protein
VIETRCDRRAAQIKLLFIRPDNFVETSFFAQPTDDKKRSKFKTALLAVGSEMFQNCDQNAQKIKQQ